MTRKSSTKLLLGLETDDVTQLREGILTLSGTSIKRASAAFETVGYDIVTKLLQVSKKFIDSDPELAMEAMRAMSKL
jgi:hypothetical protein